MANKDVCIATMRGMVWYSVDIILDHVRSEDWDYMFPAGRGGINGEAVLLRCRPTHSHSNGHLTRLPELGK